MSSSFKGNFPLRVNSYELLQQIYLNQNLSYESKITKDFLKVPIIQNIVLVNFHVELKKRHHRNSYIQTAPLIPGFQKEGLLYIIIARTADSTKK